MDFTIMICDVGHIIWAISNDLLPQINMTLKMMTTNTNLENTENRRLESLAQTVQQRMVFIKNFLIAIINDTNSMKHTIWVILCGNRMASYTSCSITVYWL